MICMQEFPFNGLSVLTVNAVDRNDRPWSGFICMGFQPDIVSAKVSSGTEYVDAQCSAGGNGKQVNIVLQYIAELEINLAVGNGCITAGRDIG